jgi:hypothetical protein
MMKTDFAAVISCEGMYTVIRQCKKPGFVIKVV